MIGPYSPSNAVTLLLKPIGESVCLGLEAREWTGGRHCHCVIWTHLAIGASRNTSDVPTPIAMPISTPRNSTPTTQNV